MYWRSLYGIIVTQKCFFLGYISKRSLSEGSIWNQVVQNFGLIWYKAAHQSRAKFLLERDPQVKSCLSLSLFLFLFFYVLQIICWKNGEESELLILCRWVGGGGGSVFHAPDERGLFCNVREVLRRKRREMFVSAVLYCDAVNLSFDQITAIASGFQKSQCSNFFFFLHSMV